MYQNIKNIHKPQSKNINLRKSDMCTMSLILKMFTEGGNKGLACSQDNDYECTCISVRWRTVHTHTKRNTQGNSAKPFPNCFYSSFG